MGVPIFIPSRGRAHRIANGTIRYIPRRRLRDVTVVVPRGEEDAYRVALGAHMIDGLQISTVSPKSNIVEIRLGLLDHGIKRGDRYQFQIDDDLAFYVRRDPKLVRLWYCVHRESEEMLRRLERMMQNSERPLSMVGVPARNGSNRFDSGIEENTRIMQLQGYRLDDVAILRRNRKLVAGSLTTLEDHHFNLTFLRNGYRTGIFGLYAVGQGQTQAEGGCSHYRTVDTHRQDCERLASLHPGLVKLTQKSFKNSQNGFENRTEVVISWQKAAQEGDRKMQRETVAGPPTEEQVREQKEKKRRATESPEGRFAQYRQGRENNKIERRERRLAAVKSE